MEERGSRLGWQRQQVAARGSHSPQLAAADRIAARAARVRGRIFFMVLDAVIIVVGYSAAEVARHSERAPAQYWHHLALFVALALAVQLAANGAFGLYGRIWRHAGVEEARSLLYASSLALAVLLAVSEPARMLNVVDVAPSVVVVGCALVAIGSGVLRFHSRLFAWQRGVRRLGLRVAVIGTRDAAATLVRDMLLNPRTGLAPVAIFDDDQKVHGLTLMGVPVVGSIEDIPAASSRYSIQQVLLAIPSPPSELVERSLRAAESAGVALKILPGVSEIVGGIGRPAITSQAREPRIEDLLGRKEVVTDLDAVRTSLSQRRVLITGAGGSIGSEIARQVSGFDPFLILLDHDETHLHDTAALVPGNCEQVLVDIRERDAIFEICSKYQPEVVFHAAAHKHVPILESFPMEAAQTNVFGTLNVIEAAAAVGARRLVYISTDKAVEPASVMGASKSFGERIVLDRAPLGASYCAVRFGNVLGSRGSVIPTFREQIARGGPVTVTDPRMTRYFMSVEEAVQLVLQAAVLAERGDIFMLEMGTAVNILDLAQRMIRLSGYSVGTDIPIRIIGARKGEKVEEELRAPGEAVEATAHPSIHRLLPTPFDSRCLAEALSSLAEAAMKRDAELVRELLFSVSETGGSALRSRARV